MTSVSPVETSTTIVTKLRCRYCEYFSFKPKKTNEGAEITPPKGVGFCECDRQFSYSDYICKNFKLSID